MINEAALRDVLIGIVGTCKTNALTAQTLAREYAALRDAVLSWNPEASEIFESHQREKTDLISSLSADLSRQYDELIQKLESGLVC